MPRSASNRTLKGHVTRLSRQLEANHKILHEVAEERDAAVEERDQFRKWWHDERELIKAANAQRDEALAEAGATRRQADIDRGAKHIAETNLHRARAYIEGLLDALHPKDRPVLPWEKLSKSDEEILEAFIERRTR